MGDPDPHQATPDWSISAISTEDEDNQHNHKNVGTRNRHESGLRNYHPSEGEESLSSSPGHDYEDNDDRAKQNDSKVQEMYKLLQHLQKLVPPPPQSASANGAAAATAAATSAPESNNLSSVTAENTVLHRSQQKVFQTLEVEDASTTIEEGDLMSHDTPELNQVTPVKNRLSVQDSTKREGILNMTPPCRDVGLTGGNNSDRGQGQGQSQQGQEGTPGSSAKLQEMRGLLRELESANRKFATSNSTSCVSLTNDKTNRSGRSSSNSSRIPRRRTLNFSSTLQQPQSLSSNHQDEKVQSLEAQLDSLKSDLAKSKDELSRKEEDLSRIREQIRDMVEKWHMEKAKESSEAEKRRVETERLQSDLLEANKQLSACEAELERAVKLAAEFRLRAEEGEEERIKQDERLQQALQDNDLLKRRISEDQANLDREVRARRELEEVYNREKGENMAKQADLEKSLQEEKTRTKELESYLHKYYQKEMERIMTEKVRQLQKHIGDLESNLQKEWDEERERLNLEHKNEMEQLKESILSEFHKVLLQCSETKESLEKCLSAARNEADCLREQLRLSDKRHHQVQMWHPPPSSFERSTSPAVSVASLSSAVSYNNNLTAGPSSLPVPLPGTPPFLNNRRPSSSGGQQQQQQHSLLQFNASSLTDSPGVATATGDSSGTSVATGGALSREEKEGIIRSFEKQANLESAFASDPSFLARYRSMAAKLLDGSASSFSPEDVVNNKI